MSKLNNHTWKKESINVIFVQKNDVVSHSCKKLQILEKIVLAKKSIQPICADKILKVVCRNILKLNRSRDIATSVGFMVSKNVSQQ